MVDGVDRGWLGTRVVSETYFSTCGVVHGVATVARISARSDARSGRSPTAPSQPSCSSRSRNLHPVPRGLGDHAAVARRAARLCLPLPLRPCGRRSGRPRARNRPRAGGPPGGPGRARPRSRCDGRRPGPPTTRRLDAAERLGFSTATAPSSWSGGRRDRMLGRGRAVPGPALERRRRGARYVQIGVFGQAIDTIPSTASSRRSSCVSSGFASTPRSWRRAMTLIEDRSSRVGAARQRGRAARRLGTRLRRPPGRQGDQGTSSTRGSEPRACTQRTEGRQHEDRALHRAVQRQAAGGGGRLRIRSRL